MTLDASRRRFLQISGLSVLGLALGACGDDSGTEASGASGTGASSDSRSSSPSSSSESSESTSSSSNVGAETELTAADFAGLATCLLLPEKTAGPFPLDEQFDRRDITEGYLGHPLRLGLRVVDESCAAVPGAAVEIWHADATGDYSAFIDRGGGKDEGSATTLLRGTQTANAEGIVEFLTVFPGWYSGRAVHIHLRVHIDDATVLTSQLFFDESYIETVYADEPYAEFGSPDTSNASDSIAGDPESEGTLVSTVAADTANGRGTLGLLNLGVRTPEG